MNDDDEGRRRIVRRVDRAVRLAEELDRQELEQRRSEALRLARALALAGLPRRPTDARDLQRTLRLGPTAWLRVTYSATKGRALPYGEDRIALAGIQHLAVEQGQPEVAFGRVGQLLAMFRIAEDGRSIARLRERLDRLVGLSIQLTFGTTEEELAEDRAGHQFYIVRTYHLPTRREITAEREGQLEIPAMRVPYGVRLSDDFWSFLRDPAHQLVVPLPLLRLFTDKPIAWDYVVFLTARCGSARSVSVVPHDAMLSLFRDGDEPERNTIARLQRYHAEVMAATGGRLNAKWFAIAEPSTGGRPRKRWALRIGPSRPVVMPGRRRREVVEAILPDAAITAPDHLTD